MSKPIVVVGGAKGGVGKSTVSVGATDALLARGERGRLIESDTSNPDVWKMYRNEIETSLIDLDDANGWIELVNVCDVERTSIFMQQRPGTRPANFREHSRESFEDDPSR